VRKTVDEMIPRIDNVRLLCLTSFLNGVHSWMTRVILQPFVLTIYDSMTFVGLIEGLTNNLGPSLIQLPSGWFSDRVGRRLPLMIGSVLVVLASVMFFIVSFTRSPLFLIIGAMLLGFGTFGVPAKDSLIAESAERARRVMTYNIVAFAAALPGIFAAYLGGSAAHSWGYGSVFAAAVGLEAVCLVLFTLFVRESFESNVGEVFHTDHIKQFLKTVFVVPQRLRVYMLIITIDSFVWGVGYKIINGLLRGGENGLSLTEIGILGSIQVASWVALQIPIGRLMERYGCKTCLILSEVTGCIGLAGVAIFRDWGFWFLIPWPIFYGLVPAFWVPAVRLLLVNSMPQTRRAEILGKFALFTGVTGFLGAVTGGRLYEVMGIVLPLGFNVAGGLILATAILLFVHETRDGELAERVPAS
jgi:MFS family permease